ncbi:effector-associated constant component EACC1 [Actinoplanes solisilvae]|uniref:effector-associated constant component EACC1 n=1 Tax=Actinoplanes solisilvae TaxID=2486853 RepID=UPI000FDC0B94|nr:hypothetical protein [Actinoplanes solisilvae]
MEITLSVSADESIEMMGSLRDWLSYEPELTGLVTPLPTANNPGVLSWTTDALLVAVGSGGTLSVLAASLGVWLSQPRNADVRIEIRDGAGRSVVIDAKRVKDPERLISEAFADRTEGEHEISAS